MHFFGVQFCAVREQTFIFLDNIIRFELVASVARGNYMTLLLAHLKMRALKAVTKPLRAQTFCIENAIAPEKHKHHFAYVYCVLFVHNIVI